MMIPLILSMLLQAPVPVERFADSFVSDVTWIGGFGSGDLLSTGWFLHRCPNSCKEGNPLGVNADSRIALKAGSIFAVTFLEFKLRRWDHPRLAGIVRWLTVAFQGWAIVNNVRLAIRGERVP